jgi:hypothetical protein
MPTSSEIHFPGLDNMHNALAVNVWWNFTVSSTIPDQLESAWSTFLSRLARTHSPTSACHAATEVFVVGEEIITLLVTLREDLDFTPNFWTERNVKTDFDAQAITVTAPFSSEQSPTSWLTYQASAGAVQRPRIKSALWTLGALVTRSLACLGTRDVGWSDQRGNWRKERFDRVTNYVQTSIYTTIKWLCR